MSSRDAPPFADEHAPSGPSAAESVAASGTYTLYARFRRQRLKLVAGIASLQHARELMEKFSVERFHARDALVLVDNATGQVVADGAVADSPTDSRSMATPAPRSSRERPVSGVHSPNRPPLAAVAHPCPVPIAVTAGNEHEILYANPAFATLLQRSAPALVGRQLADVLRQPADVGRAIDEAFRTGRATFADGGLTANTGVATPWEFCVSPTFSTDGEVEGLLVVGREPSDDLGTWLRHEQLRQETQAVNERLLIANLREQELAEQASRQARQMAALLDNLTEGVVVLDVEHDVMLANPAARDMLGLATPGQPLGASGGWGLLDKSGKPFPRGEGPVERALRGERFSDLEALRVRDEEERTLLFTGSSVHEEPGGTVGVALLVLRDVTELRRRDRDRDDFLALVTHDLRSPLTTVMLSAHQLAELTSADRAEVRRNVERITASAKRMAAMVDELLQSSYLASGKMPVETKTTDLVALVRGLASSYAEGRVRVEVEAPVIFADVDGERLERALGNLVDNALKYAPADTPVVLRASRAAREARLEVVDRGPGIPPDELAHITERYFRASATRGAPGLGLGLYIAHRILEAHGGRLDIRSEVGAGSTFAAVVPLRGPGDGADGRTQVRSAAP